MPEVFRSLVVILFIATAFFFFARRLTISPDELNSFKRRKNIWLFLTLAAFLAQSFWIYTIIAIPALLYANRNESNPPALFFFILFAVPMATTEIPGMGLVNYIFDLSHARLLELFVLLPAFFSLRQRSDVIPFGRTIPDKFFAAYLVLTVVLDLRVSNLTSMARDIFYLFIDAFLPYYVLSRSLKHMQDFRDALQALVIAIMILAPIAAFEFSTHWLLYGALIDSLQLSNAMTLYLGRGGMLRALASAGHSIALGYLMVIGIGSYLFLQRAIKSKLVRRFGLGLLIVGIISSLSRGPWVGAVTVFIVFIATGRKAVQRLILLTTICLLAFPLIAVLPGGMKVINLLPIVGTTDKGSIDYRQKLLTNSQIVIMQNPWFGSADVLETPEMQAMRQGENIIDIVNSYLSIALSQGLVGLGLFVGFFAFVIRGVYRSMRSLPDKDSEEALLGRALLATLFGILVTIFTVSGITFIPIVYWSIAGIGVAYTQMVRLKQGTHSVVI
ncbi:O-antigen ligase family protein [Sideroxydans sp. CL21]|uniref:O-antigen ligase family protein n=1 Tax=Sideroxydans sp. CL21 TaxID=2600596 RepID=UPI0024BC2663|nr:O-antigen ligase family protein [Sideroxydans sp. CL21]